MKKILFIIVAFVMVVSIAGAANDSGQPAVRPGLAHVYARINAMTDCDELQAQFDQAAENHDRDSARRPRRLDLMKISSNYMQATDARMRAIGCY